MLKNNLLIRKIFYFQSNKKASKKLTEWSVKLLYNLICYSLLYILIYFLAMDDAKYENLVTRYLENDPIIPDSQFPIAARFAPNTEKGLK
ncbi:MAG: hypothetical protein AVO38_12725 [delta proteobacterium ML8_D]|jgi:hypothetical protein|nr:MAG: hypothetical protein AVO38_12725 [delta proteobacterium ML8_D]